MEVLYFGIGLILGPTIFYLGWWVGRKTSYEDKNIVPPPNPLGVPLPKLKKTVRENPPGWVDDYSEPSVAEFNKRGEL